MRSSLWSACLSEGMSDCLGQSKMGNCGGGGMEGRGRGCHRDLTSLF